MSSVVIRGKGIQGPAGPAGPQGARGPDGAQGPPGQSGQGYTNRGTWAPSTAYNVDDVVQYAPAGKLQTYVCTTAHSSSIAFTSDPYWTLWAQAGADGISAPTNTYFAIGNNLSEIQNASTARGNLGVDQSSLDNRYVKHGDLVVNVKDFGAKGDGTTDDTAAIQAAATAIASTGGTLWFPAGSFRVSSTVTIAAGIHVRGVSSASTIILSTAGLVGALSCTGDRIIVSDIYFECSASAATVTASQAVGVTWVSGNRGVVERCYFYGWYDALDFQNCAAVSVNDNFFAASVRYNLHVRNIATPDSGDWIVEGNYFQGTGAYAGVTHIRQESAGGLKLVGNKLNTGAVGYDLAVADGVGTSILNVVANSLEYQTTSAIRIRQAGPSNTGTFIKILIAANQISGDACTSPVIDINPATAGCISSIVLDSNIMSGNAHTTTFVSAAKVDDLSIDGGSMIDGGTGVSIASTVTNVFVGASIKTQNITTPVSNASASPVATNVYSGMVLQAPSGWSGAQFFVYNQGANPAFVVYNNGNALFAAGLTVGGAYQNLASLIVTPTNAHPAAIIRSGGGTVDLLQFTNAAGSTVFLSVDQYGHLVATGNGTPTVAAGAAAGTSPTVSIGTGSSDTAGILNVTVGTSPASGSLAVVTFANAFVGNVRAVLLEPLNSATAALATSIYIGAKSSTSFQVNSVSAPTAAAALSWMYQVVG